MISKYSEFINEGIRDKMTPKSKEDIEKSIVKQKITEFNAEKLLKNAIEYNLLDFITKIFDVMMTDYASQHELDNWRGDDTFVEFCQDVYGVNISQMLSISIVINPDIETNTVIPLICEKCNIDINRDDIQDAFETIKSINDIYDKLSKKYPNYRFVEPSIENNEDFIEYLFTIFTKSNEGYLVGVKSDMEGNEKIYYTYCIEPFGDDDDYCNYLNDHKELINELKKVGLEL